MTAPARSSLALLRLLRLASPSLPVGGFSYSEGLEGAVDGGAVADETTALAWLADQLHLALARSDLAVVALAFDAWSVDDGAGLAALNRWLAATRESAELRAQTEQMGRSMAQWLRLGHADARLGRLDALEPVPSWPLAFALAAVLAGASRADAVLAFAGAWAENQAQAAMRAVPLGQSAGQRLIAALHDEIVAATEVALATPFDDLEAFTPGLAIVSARHETQYSRLFRS